MTSVEALAELIDNYREHSDNVDTSDVIAGVILFFSVFMPSLPLLTTMAGNEAFKRVMQQILDAADKRMDTHEKITYSEHQMLIESHKRFVELFEDNDQPLYYLSKLFYKHINIGIASHKDGLSGLVDDFMGAQSDEPENPIRPN